jgi:nucleotide-binding universal stress UspA family protein
MRILLAVDGSAYSDAAVEEVACRPWPPNSEIRVITAFEISMYIGMDFWTMPPEYFEKLEQAAGERAKRVVDDALTKLESMEDKTLQISSDVIEGQPRQVIVEEADRWNADLVVMGSRGLGAWSRLLLGSVSSGVVHHAPCSVEIVRRAQPDKR